MATASSAVDAKVEALIEESRSTLQPAFAAIDRNTEQALNRVLTSFRTHKIGSEHFASVDGYGHGDLGRAALDGVYAELMGAEAALVRIQIMSGTHAIACALFGVLRPADELLAVSGAPYDTLEEVIGLRGRTADGLRGTLADFGVTYSQVELTPEGAFDLEAIGAALTPATRVLHVQRSCGYTWRPSISIGEIGRLSAWLAAEHPQLVLFVDNCYGEFVESLEPCAVGAHLVAGSLIKNPGGTLAPSGGYVAGRRDLVDAAARRLGAPGVEGGATLGMNRPLFQGLFHAPQVVGEALKGACLVADVLGRCGYECNPPAGSERTDIIQAVRLRERAKVWAPPVRHGHGRPATAAGVALTSPCLRSALSGARLLRGRAARLAGRCAHPAHARRHARLRRRGHFRRRHIHRWLDARAFGRRAAARALCGLLAGRHSLDALGARAARRAARHRRARRRRDHSWRDCWRDCRRDRRGWRRRRGLRGRRR